MTFARKPPDFWFQSGSSWQARLLMPLGSLWDKKTQARLKKNPHYKAPIPVISVGSPMMAGTGKTPTCLWLADGLKERGFAPAILSRGYGGRYEKQKLPDAHLVNAKQDKVSDVGDEPFMMAGHKPNHPIIIHPDRGKSAKLALRIGADCLIMDDGRTNPSLHKDIHILTLDGAVGFGNGQILPAGPLRENGKKALIAADFILMIGDDKTGFQSQFQPLLDGKLFQGNYKMSLDDEKASVLKSSPLLAFCALANGNKFFDFLTQHGFDIKAKHDFPDHHAYSLQDEEKLLNEAKKLNAKLVATAKDKVKLSKKMQDEVVVIDIGLEVHRDKLFFETLFAQLEKIKMEHQND